MHVVCFSSRHATQLFQRHQMSVSALPSSPHSHNHIGSPQLSFLSQALDLARESNDNIKDEIWHELAQVEFMHWEDRSAQQLHAQQQLQQRMQQVLQLQYHQEATAQVRTTHRVYACQQRIESAMIPSANA